MPRPKNAFLRSLPADAYETLERGMTPLDLEMGASLRHPGEPIDSVYFPESLLGSLLGTSSEGETLETSMVGNEGADGILEACGTGVSGLEVQVQLPGRAWRVPASLARQLASVDEGFRRRVWMLTEYQMSEARQSAFCIAMHTVEARFARWLLESYERSGLRNPLTMTQEFIAAMLGVQRSTVSGFAGQLQKAGLIDYRRGLIELRDVEALERRACECRRATLLQRERVGLALSE